MAAPVNEIAASGVKAAGSFREVVQDLLVPELRAVKVQIEALTQEMRLRNEQQREDLKHLTEEMRLRDGQREQQMLDLSQQMKLRDDQLIQEMRLRDEQQKRSNEVLSQKLDFAIEIRERLAHVEARLPKQ